MTASAEELRLLGNEHYKQKNYLKAAALYTQALKIDENNAILYSNRCMALLMLKKVTKALADAEKACELRPDWEKAHFRRGRALEDLERYEESLAAYMRSAEIDPTPETKEKVKNLKVLLRKNATAPPRPDGLKNSEEYRVAQDQVMQEIESGSELDFSHDRVMSFAKDTLSETVASLRRGEAPGPSVTFLPGWHTKDGEERLGHVSVKAAFESPETREACGQFLCKYAADYRAHAAVLVVARKDVAFPQVWRRNGWTMGNIGGWFVQLESEAARRVWFIPVPKGKPAQDPVLLDDSDKWSILPRLFQ